MSDDFVQIKESLNSLASPESALKKARFYKTSQGAYAENTKFIGPSTPDLKIIAKKFQNLPRGDIKLLLESEIHEERALALFILVGQYKSGDASSRQKIYDFYLQNVQRSTSTWLDHAERCLFKSLQNGKYSSKSNVTTPK